MATNATREDYMRERLRIQRFIRRAEDRGYHFNQNPGREIIPNNPTQDDVERLKAYTPDRLYSQATVERTVTDIYGQAKTETYTGTEYRKVERSEAGRRGYQAHYEAQQEGYSNVEDWRAETQTFKQEPVESIEEPIIETNDSYAMTAAKQSMSDEYAQDFGYASVEQAFESEQGMNFIRGWYKHTYPNMSEPMNTDLTATPVTGYTPEDTEEAIMRAEAEADNYDEVSENGSHSESELIYDDFLTSLNNMSYYGDASGASRLSEVFGRQVGYYGRDAVIGALAELEESDPDLLDELNDLLFYQENGLESVPVSRAFRALSDAITAIGEGGISSHELGSFMEAMEVFDEDE